jgi:type VI secretion system protein ImpL
MDVAYLITAVLLLAYLALVWILGSVLQLKSPDIWVFRGGLALIGIGAAAAYIWWRRSRGAAAGCAPEPVDSSNEIDVLMRDAEARLSAARVSGGSHIANFPLIFLVGETGAAKTTILANSGLEPELLAGQVYQDNNIVPTRSANLWFSRNTIFVEAGGKLLADRGLWSRAIRRSRAGKLSTVAGTGDQSPRAAVVCFDAERFTQPGAAESAAASARNLHDRLMEISSTLGINFPVYVLFTRTDRLPFFREYVRNLSNEEATQVVGATLPLSAPQSAGIYGEQQGARVGAAFDALFRSLCDARCELLAREGDEGTLPATYEFPREFRKIRGAMLQFLVDLCRPSQLTTAPFLRGFYFSGVRPVTVDEYAPAAAAAGEPQAAAGASDATGIFRAGQRAQTAPVAQRVTGSRRVPQWMFLSHLFYDVVLQDRTALAASASSTKTSFARRVLMACAAVVCLILAICFLTSWMRNRNLEARAVEAARGISSGESIGLDLPSLEALQRLDTLRQTVAELGVYERDGAPLSMRWGLYAGSDLYPEARRAYFNRFRQLLFTQTETSLLGTLQRLPGSPGPQDEYAPAYDTLKAYLITTSHHQYSSRAFLAPVLMRHWTQGRTVDPQRLQLAQAQFEFYAGELKDANPYGSDNDGSAIERGRRYLAQFAGIERVYQNMLADAGKTNPPIQFNRRFPGSAEVVVDTREVSGAFTKGGWAFMKDALRHADKYFSGEQWVLGDQTTANFDHSRLEQQLRDRYVADFIAQWRAYLKSATVVRYAGIPDAARKLNLLSGNQSPLLALFWLASQNTAVDEPKIASAFQPVQIVVPPANVDRYIATPNQPYMSGLTALQTSLEQIAAQPGQVSEAAAGQVLSNAVSAKSAERSIAQAFPPDPDGKVDSTVQKLMEDPITYVEGLLRTLGPSELNGKGKALCAQMRPLLSKYPFAPGATQQATLAEVNAILHRPDGALWAFYDANLQRLLPKQGSQYVAASAGGINLNPAFVAFFNRWSTLADAFYSGGSADPHLTYTLKPVASEGIQSLTLRLDGQTLTAPATGGTAKQFTWPGSATREAKAAVKFGGTDLGWSDNDGLWAVFQFFEEAERWVPSGGAYDLEWTVRAGKKAMTLPSGKPLTVRFELNMSGAPPVFEKGYLSRLGCVADVAK